MNATTVLSNRPTAFFLTAFFCVFIFLNFFRPLDIEDVWWHLKTGEWIVTHGQVPHQDLFPFGQEQTPWIFTQWLGSSILYLVYEFTGLLGLKIFRALFFTGVLLVFFRYALKRTGFPMAAALLLILVPPLYSRSFVRPDMFNYLLIQVFFIILFRFHNTNDPRQLLALPLLGALWSNVHLGSFVYGVPLIGVFLVSNAISRQWQKTGALAVMLVLYVAAFTISPYGHKALVYPLDVFLKPDHIHFYFSLNVIEEMASPLEYLKWDTGFWAVILAALAAFAVFKKGNSEHRLLHILLLAFSLGMFLRGVRAGAFFALTAAFVIAEALHNAPAPKPAPSMNIVRRCFWLGVIAVLSVKGVSLYNKTVIQDGKPVREMDQIVNARNPQAALTFMKERGIAGQVFNDDSFGGYMIWSAYPHIRPFTDGRQVDKEKFIKFIEITQDPGTYWPRLQEEFQFKTLLLNPNAYYTAFLIECLGPGWTLVYKDAAALVFIREEQA